MSSQPASRRTRSSGFARDLMRIASPDDVWLESDHLPNTTEAVERSQIASPDDARPSRSGRRTKQRHSQESRNTQGTAGRTDRRPETDAMLQPEKHPVAKDGTSLQDTDPDNTEPYDGEAKSAGEWLHEATEMDLDDSFDEFEIDRTDGDVHVGVDFSIEAHQPLWDVDVEALSDQTLTARLKAARIVPMLAISHVAERDTALELLIEFFQRHPHGATRVALERAATAGLNLELLQSMIALREIISERTEFWVGRYGPRSFSFLRQRASAFSWVLLRRICSHQSDFPSDMMVGDDWLSEWYHLLPGEPGYLSFPDYLHQRIQCRVARALNDGLMMLHHDDTQILPSERCGVSGEV